MLQTRLLLACFQQAEKVCETEGKGEEERKERERDGGGEGRGRGSYIRERSFTCPSNYSTDDVILVPRVRPKVKCSTPVEHFIGFQVTHVSNTSLGRREARLETTEAVQQIPRSECSK